jgi:hypothetical protein
MTIQPHNYSVFTLIFFRNKFIVSYGHYVPPKKEQPKRSYIQKVYNYIENCMKTLKSHKNCRIKMME